MKRWRGWQCFKQSVLLPTKCMLLKACQHLRPRAKGKRLGLLGVYKDIESCRGYEDIQVMWEIILSSCPTNDDETPSSNKRPSYCSFCFRPA